MKTKTRVRQTGISYPSMRKYFELEKYCPNCKTGLGIIQGRVTSRGKPIIKKD